MKYETGMQIVYDVLNKGILVEFRGQPHYFPGPFKTQKQAVSAGEALCRELGWGKSDGM
ncbi:hypothetical protein MNR02_08770 [Shinella sp. H4-D48]|uniref:hypothetical protein n=1 Tax=Shinella sp. H4-D48 TaxID=2925841 RepID=UPI001F52EA71|nr:hypothetical protein [Shinella sp. H4-D48]UNK36606.1 hypothetical protein MNR02_08770 [Shinella sp. H4-D48]